MNQYFLSAKDKFLVQLKSEFNRTIKLNKYRSTMTVQTNNRNLNSLIDTTFTKINKLNF